MGKVVGGEVEGEGGLLGGLGAVLVIVAMRAGREKLRSVRCGPKGRMCMVSCGEAGCRDGNWSCLAAEPGEKMLSMSMTRSERHTDLPVELILQIALSLTGSDPRVKRA